MKLLFCLICTDTIRLMSRKRFCQCKRSWGKYTPNGVYGKIGGAGIAIGMDNHTLADAVRYRPHFPHLGREVYTFVFPVNSDRILPYD